MIASMVSFFTSVGLTSADVGIKINSRLVVAEVLASLGIGDDKFAATCVIIDKLDKMPIDALEADLAELGITKETASALTDILAAKSLSDLSKSLPPDSPALASLTELFGHLDAVGVSDWAVFDASVIRGLSYYTGCVFEAFDRKGELRAIAGGGRYDELLESFGGEATPAAGFGFGDAVIVELLKERGLLPEFEKGEVDCVVYCSNESLLKEALKVSQRLRQVEGLSVDAVLEPKKAKWAFKHADRIGARFVVVVGEDEWARGEIGVKNMDSGEQKGVEVEGIEKWGEEEVVRK